MPGAYLIHVYGERFETRQAHGSQAPSGVALRHFSLNTGRQMCATPAAMVTLGARQALKPERAGVAGSSHRVYASVVAVKRSVQRAGACTLPYLLRQVATSGVLLVCDRTSLTVLLVVARGAGVGGWVKGRVALAWRRRRRP